VADVPLFALNPLCVGATLIVLDFLLHAAVLPLPVGKTASFLMPALSKLDYPPELFPEDLEGPQLLLLVPSFELGVQACMLLYKLWGGNVSSRTPGDPANMFTYNGPAGIKVRHGWQGLTEGVVLLLLLLLLLPALV
jgi:hypothetical protein